MGGQPLTRRSLLTAGAGAMAGGLLRPGGALALLAGPPRPTLTERRLGELPPQGATIELAGPADLLGLEWSHPAGARVWLRFGDARRGWSDWVSAGASGHGPDVPGPTDRLVGEPIWTGGATEVQIRSRSRLSGARLHLVDVSGGVGARNQRGLTSPLAIAAALPLAAPVLAAGAGQPPIIARRGWAQGMAPPRVTPEYGKVRLAFVHHTDNPNGYAPGEVPGMLRAIYAFHRYVNGWNDIGYNFVLDAYGRIFEGRAGGIDEAVVGAHAGGYNLVSTGVAVLGTFMAAPISAAARGALEGLLAWKLSLHGLPAQGRVTVRVNPAGAFYSRFPANTRVSLSRIAGHRDGDSTDCPGNVLYGELPAIRRGVRGLAPRPTRVTLSILPAAPPSGQVPSSAPGAEAPGMAGGGEARTLAGRLEFLDGTPIAGATVIVQARSVSRRGEVVQERTVAEAATDGEGRWSLSALLSAKPGGTSLRALSTGAAGFGAAVSDPLRLPGAVSLSAPAAAAPTPPAAAPPAQ
jgi:hypothetical protein